MVTAGDVAKRTGASQATVSYAMSGGRPISEAIKKRVRKVMDESGYVPNTNARPSAGGKVGVIGVLVHTDENIDLVESRPFLVVIMEEARKRGSSVMFVPVDEGIEGPCCTVRQGVVDGVLASDVERHDEHLPGIARLDIPAVLVDTLENAYDLSCVDVDYRRVAQMVVNRLAERGAQRMVLVRDWGRSSDRYALAKFFASEFRAVAQMLDMEYEIFISREKGWRGIWVMKDELKRMAQCHDGIAVRTPQVSDSLLQLCVEMQIQPGRDFSPVAVHVDGHDEELRALTGNADPVPQSIVRAATGLLFDRIDGHKTSERLLVFPHITIRN